MSILQNADEKSSSHLSEDQASALGAMLRWLRNPHGQQVFRLYGAAGCGKTTLMRALLETSGLTPFGRYHMSDGETDSGGDVIVAAPTAKAAMVLGRKLPDGFEGRTIHSIIYKLEAAETLVAAALRQDLVLATHAVDEYRAQEDADPDVLARLVRDRAGLARRLRYETRPRFVHTDDPDTLHARLLVVDEASMVGEAMAADLMASDIRILVVGDPFQLPPVQERPGFTSQPADATLTVVHRQAAGGGVFTLADAIRRGETLKPGADYGDGVQIVAGLPETIEELLPFDQIICRKNRTRMLVNNAVRDALGFTGAMPTSRHERLICSRNDAALGIVNGMQVRLANAIASGHSLVADIQPCGDDGKPMGNPAIGADVWPGNFLAHLDPDAPAPADVKRGMAMLDFAYAITAHKAQGSEFDTIAVLVEPGGGSRDEQQRWLYTAVTRAKKGVTVYLGGAQ